VRRGVAEALLAFGEDGAVYEVDFGWVTGEGWGCDWHPNVVTHDRLGHQPGTGRTTAKSAKKRRNAKGPCRYGRGPLDGRSWGWNTTTTVSAR
jgi:hypothetical protein